MSFDETKLHAFVCQFVTDVHASVHATMVVLGRRLGLYQALEAGIGPLLTHAGFSTARRVAQTPFNIIYQAQP